MQILKKLKDSSKELSNITTITVCAMMIALRVVLGMFTNFTLAVVPFVKIGFSFIPIVITAFLFGPVPAALINALGDILSVIISNPTSFSIIPGITVCCFIEGLIYGIILYKEEPAYKKIIIAKALVLLLCSLPLNTVFLSAVMNIPYLNLLLYRCAVLIPFSIVEVFADYFILKFTKKTYPKLIPSKKR